MNGQTDFKGVLDRSARLWHGVGLITPIPDGISVPRGDGGGQPTWYTVRLMKEAKPELNKGDFVKVTGKLKADFYLSREGKPTGTLLIIAFEAAKIAKPQALSVEEVE